MNKRLKARWVKALRSGKYTQGRFRLANTDELGRKSFCCLGVLRELDPNIATFEGGNGILEAESCGIPEGMQRVLTAYNDGGKSFAWIASSIERRKSL